MRPTSVLRTKSLFVAVAYALSVGSASVQAQTPDEATAAVATNDAAVRGTLLSPKAFRAAAEKVRPSLVRIEGFGGVAGNVGAAGFRPPGEGPTTGLILSSDGYVITSTFNFLRQPPVITVVLPSGERKVARLLGRDETRKLCVLKIDGVSNLPVPELLPHNQVRVGQWAIALGVGFGGKEPALTAGIISATHRISAKAVQTDANLSPANYGGPLIDLDGRVIGLCVPLSPQAGDAAAGAEWYDSGIGFAVPLAENAERIEALKQGQTFQPPFLGVQTVAKGEPPSGAHVAEVVAGSPAEKAGLLKDDQIVAVGAVEVLDATHLATLIGRSVAGERTTLKIRRGDSLQTLEVEYDVQPAPPPKPVQPAENEKPPDPKLPQPKSDEKR